jgi:rhodanese-related sulfurtransferase
MRHLSLILLACCLTGGLASGLSSAETCATGACPTEVSTTIDKATLEKAIAAKSVCLLDVNGTESFRQGHIPGAIDVQANAKQFAKILPASKSALIVAYCGSSTCGAYKGATDAATKLGYTNVKHYAGGLAGWVKDGGQLVK